MKVIDVTNPRPVSTRESLINLPATQAFIEDTAHDDANNFTRNITITNMINASMITTASKMGNKILQCQK